MEQKEKIVLSEKIQKSMMKFFLENFDTKKSRTGKNKKIPVRNERTRKRMRTAIYVRVSTDEQAKEGYSIRAQIDKLKNYIQLKDWEFYKVYEDECDIIEQTQ